MTSDHAPAPPAGSPKWFYKTDAGKIGPVSPEQLANLLANATLPPDTQVWRHGMPAWCRAAESEEFADATRSSSARSSSTSVAFGGRRFDARTIRLAALGAAAAALLLMLVGVRFLGRKPAVVVRGAVMADSRPVEGGTIVLSPVADGVAKPGKPGVCGLGPTGEFAVRIEAGEAGLARRARVRYVPPVLPPMSEKEARTAVPRYFGLVPKQEYVSLDAAADIVTVELVSPERVDTM